MLRSAWVWCSSAAVLASLSLAPDHAAAAPVAATSTSATAARETVTLDAATVAGPTFAIAPAFSGAPRPAWGGPFPEHPYSCGALLVGPWRYLLEDRPEYAATDFDDSAWPTTLAAHDLAGDESWPGVAWFRMRLDVAPELAGKALGLMLPRTGDIELYLDGKLVHSFGDVPRAIATKESSVSLRAMPRLITFDAGHHLLALRFANARSASFGSGGIGFQVFIGEPETLATENAQQDMDVMETNRFFCGVAVALALLHFVLFLFNRSARENLYFALHTTAVAGIVNAATSFGSVHTMSEVVVHMAAFRFSILATGFFGLVAIYSVFYPKFPRQLWPVAVAGGILAIFTTQLTVVMVYVYALICLLEELRAIAVAVWRKKPGAWIIGIGWTLFLIACALQMLADMDLVAWIVPFIYLYGLGGLLVAMSCYLARGIAKTTQDLASQLVQVRELSAITLEQERRAKEAELTRKLLEADNAAKARELEEAKKLEQALKELEQTNRDLKSTQGQLAQSEKMASLGMLVAGVAHEINTPIGAIASVHNSLALAVEKLRTLLRDSFPDAFIKEPRLERTLNVIDDSTKVIESGSTRVAGIVRRLRSFARLDEAELKKVDIHEGLEDTLLLLQHELKHGITVTKDYGPLPPIACYPSLLNQVFLNMLVNARQALKDGKGTLGITTRLRDRWVEIEFADNGIGIPAENLRRIFDPGFTTKGVGVGTGLGLSICYRIVQQHRGEIRVESQPGIGTKFTVVIPADLDQHAA